MASFPTTTAASICSDDLRRLRDVIGLEIGDGTAELMKAIIARDLRLTVGTSATISLSASPNLHPTALDESRRPG